MFVDFEKWHGCLNDFIVIWTPLTQIKNMLPSLQRKALDLCSRKGNGVGADGILLIGSDPLKKNEPKEVHIINADGSLAKHCGNGMRCIIASTFRRQEKQSDDLFLSTFTVEGRPVSGEILSSYGSQSFVSVHMGEYSLDAGEDWSARAHNVWNEVKRAYQPKGVSDLTPCFIGNRHLMIECERVSPGLLEDVSFLFKDSEFKECNVHLYTTSSEPSSEVKALARRYLKADVAEYVEAMTWEAGAGPTQACGSGACAIATKVFSEGMVPEDAWVCVKMPGGLLFVKQSHDKTLTLAGPATFVFRGTFEL